MLLPLLSLESGHNGQINQPIEAVIHMQVHLTSGSWQDAAQPSMRLVQHLTAIRAWCKQCLPGWENPDVPRPGIVGIRGSMVLRLRPC